MDNGMRHVLVIGGGIGGMRSAMDLAETGHTVTIVERSPVIGGLLSALDAQFPTDGCGMCRMLPTIDRDQAAQRCLRKGLVHRNIEILTDTEVLSVEGEAGKFSATVRTGSGYVDSKRCMGCGLCVEVCPVNVPDSFNVGFSMRKAVYTPLPHAWPPIFRLDPVSCTRCGACRDICPTGAIHLPGQEKQDFPILVVDDEPIVRDSIRDWLHEEEGFHVETAESGKQALEKLQARPFCLMLLDIKMPEMDGVEVLEKARKLVPDLSVIMMTAYATVETAVEAMKIGALDYLIKPFEPDALIPKVMQVYQVAVSRLDRQIRAGAVVINAGSALFNPMSGSNVMGYSRIPGVVTSLEFERIISHSGPFAGSLLRPGDNRPVRRIAWLQCIGSRDFQSEADFCSRICCMISIKEAVLATRKFGPGIEASIYYMDMRTYGKSYQRYRDQAESEAGVRFIRGRVHSMMTDKKTGELILRYADRSGTMQESAADMAVLAIGQRPLPAMKDLSGMFHLSLNSWGFPDPDPFFPVRSQTRGVFLGGSVTGLRDIRETVILSSAAALNASRILHGAEWDSKTDTLLKCRDISREPPRVRVLVCSCNRCLEIDESRLLSLLAFRPFLERVQFVGEICTPAGMDRIAGDLDSPDFNRLVIGACPQQIESNMAAKIEQRLGLSASLMEMIDIHTSVFRKKLLEISQNSDDTLQEIARLLEAGINRLAAADPEAGQMVPITPRALVVGAGIAGMTAALALADHGYPVDLVEKENEPGGNLTWLHQTPTGEPIHPFLTGIIQKIQNHPQVTLHTETRVAACNGQAGRFHSILEKHDRSALRVDHGITILATGGREAEVPDSAVLHHPAVLTQKALEIRLTSGNPDIGQWKSVVMIQCAGTRQEPRNYCSRVCCTTSLRQASVLQTLNPDISVFILYRDMMTLGFSESAYTQARKSGVIFIAVEKDAPPDVQIKDEKIYVQVDEPVLGRPVRIEADAVILAAGITASPNTDLCHIFGIDRNPDGFYQEADIKWKPVSTPREGVFACGIGLAPGSIPESIASAEAAAQQALVILSHAAIDESRVMARVRNSLCSLCEQCIAACPYGARSLETEWDRIVIDPLRCQGCGACAAICPNDAAVMNGWLPRQMFGTIDACLSENPAPTPPVSSET